MVIHLCSGLLLCDQAPRERVDFWGQSTSKETVLPPETGTSPAKSGKQQLGIKLH